MHTVAIYYRARNPRGALAPAKYLGDHQFAEMPFKGLHLALPGSLCGSEKPAHWVEVMELVLPVKGVRPHPAALVYARPGTELEALMQGTD